PRATCCPGSSPRRSWTRSRNSSRDGTRAADAAAGLASARAGVRGQRPMAMEDLAPTAVVLAAGLHAAEQICRRAHEAVIGALMLQRVRVAPAHVEDLGRGVGIGLAAWTVRPAERRRVPRVVRHREPFMAKCVPTSR